MTAFQKQPGTVAQAPVDSDGGWGQVIESIPSQGDEGLNVCQPRHGKRRESGGHVGGKNNSSTGKRMKMRESMISIL